MKNHLTKTPLARIVAGTALALALPLAASAQSMPAASSDAGSLAPGTYQVLDDSGRRVGELIYGGGANLRVTRAQGAHAVRETMQTGSAFPSGWEAFYQDSDSPALLDTP